MPRKQKLKVYRTPIGFHDAYVAAASQKAALEAWGSDADLFARGVAEIVTDPKLAAEPLAKPGEVIRRSRGTAAEQIAALPRGTARRAAEAEPAAKHRSVSPKHAGAKTAAPKRSTPNKAAPRRKPPRPSRAPLDAAERTIVETERRHDKARQKLAREFDALQKKRRRLDNEQAREIDRLRRARDEAEARYEDALREWQG